MKSLITKPSPHLSIKSYLSVANGFLMTHSKNQRYYELVLIDSGSIELYHTMDKNNPDKISYSKCIIKRIIKPTEWSSLAIMKDFTVNFILRGYSYHDYRMAWYRAFLYRPFDHSWLFTFHSNCQEDFAIWFYEWWHSYGPTTDILPPTVLKRFNLHLLKTKGLHYMKTVQFYKEFKVPWIFCWSYKIAQHYNIADKFSMSLFREFTIKWWDKFNQTPCSDIIVTEFLATGKKLQHHIQQAAKQKDSPITPKSIPKIPVQEDSDSDDEFQQFLQFQKFKKMQKQLNRSRASSSTSSSSVDHIGGQVPFEM